MTSGHIIETIPPIADGDKDRLQVFIPYDQGAVCADCGGMFLQRAGKCPGCGSAQYILVAMTSLRVGK